MLNRSALIVRPLQPYIDWATSLDDSGLVPPRDGEKTVYLLPEWDDDAEAEKLLRRVHREIFERELFGWHTDEAAWPQRRTFAMFKKWFSVEMHSVVEDMCAGPLLDDDV